MSEQLSMFSNSDPLEPLTSDDQLPPVLDANPDVEYEALDYQLSDLMVELNDYEPEGGPNFKIEKKALNKTLRQCTLEISKRTREGQISLEISADQRSQLLLTTVVGMAGDYMPLIVDAGEDGCDSYLYLNRYWLYQQRLADQINARIQSKLPLSDAQLTWAHTRLAEYFPSDPSSNETNWQRSAAELALQQKFLILSGGPGTGKTTTITRLLALLIEQHQNRNDDEIIADESKQPKSGGVSFNILLAAPTGKAAIRMLDSMREASNALQKELSIDDLVVNQLPTDAHTIHKLLGYKHNSAQFKHNKNNLLNADVVLVDEASMIDVALMSKLVDAIPDHAKLILVGDKDQLASVETGSVFADICEGLKNGENLITLKKNWRFGIDSDIGQAANASNQGDSKTLLQILNDPARKNAELIAPSSMRDAELVKPWQHYFAVVNNPDSSLDEIFAAFSHYRVLCALRRGFNGSEIINERIEAALQKQGLIQRRRSSNTQQNSSGYSRYYHGRPIMISQNSYSKGLMNGDTGITLMRNGEINIYFPNASFANEFSFAEGSQLAEGSLSADGSQLAEGSLSADGSLLANGSSNKYKSFTPVRLPAHETTWSMTIHKSQGSEFDHVMLILPQEEMPLLTRQLIYTGVTRAKQQVSIIASEDVLMSGVKKEVVKATNIDQQIKASAETR